MHIILGYISYVISAYSALIIIHCLMTWMPPTKSGWYAEVYYSIGLLVEPYLALFRKYIPAFGGIDFSPIFAILVLEAIQRFL